VGNITIGGGAPIRVQSMNTTNTNDTEACVAQAKRIISAGGEWSFLPNDASHPIWQNLIGGNEKIITTDAGYQISNCVSQWGSWSFSGFADWESKTGCKALGHGGDGAVVVWEAPASDGSFGKGGIICFGSGCYDWYSPNPYEPNYHNNVGIMTGNAFRYLSGK